MYAVNTQSDINIWTKDNQAPAFTWRGHNKEVKALGNFNNQTLVSGDSEGRLLFWDVATKMAKRPTTNFQGVSSVLCIATNSQFVYVSYANG